MTSIKLFYILGHPISVSIRMPVGIFKVQQVSVFSATTPHGPVTRKCLSTLNQSDRKKTDSQLPPGLTWLLSPVLRFLIL